MARPIGEIVRPIILKALGLGRLNDFLSEFAPRDREAWIADFESNHTITADEASILREQHRLEAA